MSSSQWRQGARERGKPSSANQAPRWLTSHWPQEVTKAESKAKVRACTICLQQAKLSNWFIGTSLVVQRPRLRPPNAGSQGSVVVQGIRSQMPQLRPGEVRLIF